MRASFRNCIVGSLSLLPLALVYADDGNPRYVASTGVDSGDCRNKFRPCRTLSYAIAKAGKGDVVSVAEGRYELHTARELTDLLAMQGRVAAGFDKHTGFADRNAADRTLLVGVPPELRERFEQDGFTVISDTKSLFDSADKRAESQRKRTLAASVLASEQSHAAAPCTGNQSNGFACQNMSLLAHLPLPQLQPASASGNDIWGFVDLNTGREYVFMGLQQGIAILDITNPAAPEQVAFATGSNSTWRDITVYQRYDASARRWRAYAYATADGVNDFLVVLDLSNLPNGVERVNFSSDFRNAHTNYLVNADYTFGIAESTGMPQLGISGAGIGQPLGSFRLYSLADARAPQLLSASNAGYAHDIASFALGDDRKNTQCVNASTAAKCQVLADFNENTVDIWDVTNPAAPSMLISRTYGNRAYTHSGWWTEDGRYLLLHDELDEPNLGLNTTVRVFNMSDLRAPQLAGSWIGPTRAIDHNGYVRGNRYYFSNYSEGATVLDITNPAAPQRVGYFDTYPSSSGPAFVGAWGIYPFFPSGTVAVSDINTGLYLLKDETQASSNGSLAFASRAVHGAEGQSIALTIARTGGSAGAVSVTVDLLYGTADASDAALGSSTVNWAAGDTQPKTLMLSLSTDAQSEAMEVLFARLRNPQGGATLALPDLAYVHIADSGATTRLRLLEETLRIDETRRKALVTVTRGGSAAGAAQVSFRTLPSTSYSGFTAQQGDLTWVDGDVSAKTISIDIEPARLTAGQSGRFQVEFYGAVNAELEAASGAVATLSGNVTVVGDGQGTPPPASDDGKKGGGSMALWLLALLAALAGGASRARSGLRTHHSGKPT